MKALRSVIKGIVITLTLCSVVFAQNFDAKRMNRDLNILESVLAEMFKTEAIAMMTNSGSIFSVGANSVRGTYLDGFGVIFMVPSPDRFHTFPRTKAFADGDGFTFYYSDDSGEEIHVTKETVIDRIGEFLKNYAPTIGQLKEDEKVAVIFGAETTGRGAISIVRMHSNLKIDDEDKYKPLPVLSVVVSKKDLDAYRTGTLSGEQFEDKLSVAENEKQDYLDLKVMGNIFTTALKEHERESFRLSGTVNHLYLQNFGAIFSFDVRYSSVGDLPSVTFGRMLEHRSSDERTQITLEQLKEETKKEQEEKAQKIKLAYDELVKNLKEYLVDYGRTLGSVKSGQHILVSVNIRNRMRDIPDRIDLQIKKSVVESMDRGSVSREEAMEQVTGREF